jgi:hypothetical protein
MGNKEKLADTVSATKIWKMLKIIKEYHNKIL